MIALAGVNNVSVKIPHELVISQSVVSAVTSAYNIFDLHTGSKVICHYNVVRT